MSTPEHTLIETWIRSRDGEAFRRIVETYGGMVYASAKRILGNATDAEDLTQECFAVLAGQKQPPKAPLGPWLHRVVINLSLNRVKSERSRSAREKRFAAEVEQVLEPSWPEVERILDKAIAELPERLRALIVAHYLLGKSQSVIASEMGLSQQAVSYRIGKAIEGLRSALKHKGVTMASAALTAFLASQTADALPPALALTLGKTALATACGAAPPSAAALPLAVKGVLAVTTATKVGVGVGAAAAIVALVWFSGVATVGKTSPGVKEANGAVPTQTKRKGDAQAAAPANTEVAISAAQTASSAQEPPIAGLWRVVSYVMIAKASGERDEIFDPDRVSFNPAEPPLARLETQGNSLKITFLEPWKRLAPYETLEGTRDEQTVEIRAGEEDLPIAIHGSFDSTWTQFTAEGTYRLEEASRRYLGRRQASPEEYAELESHRLEMILKKLGEVESKTRLTSEDMLEKRHKEADAFAKALVAYASAHRGALPANLAALAEEKYIDESLLNEVPDRKLDYAGGAIPEGLLNDGTPWDQFNLTEPMGERIASWEAYQQQRWGMDSPVLSPALTIEYDAPYLQFSIDAFGNTMERDYRADAPGAEDTNEARTRSQDNLKELAVLLHIFMSKHDGVFPEGWCSLYPDSASVSTLLTYPLDAPGTSSYVLFLPGENLTTYAEAAAAAEQAATGEATDATRLWAEIPLIAEAREHGTNPAGRCVAMADGHALFMTSEQFSQACERFGIAIP